MYSFLSKIMKTKSFVLMEDKKSLSYFRLITEFYHHENNLSFIADCPYIDGAIHF